MNVGLPVLGNDLAERRRTVGVLSQSARAWINRRGPDGCVSRTDPHKNDTAGFGQRAGDLERGPTGVEAARGAKYRNRCPVGAILAQVGDDIVDRTDVVRRYLMRRIEIVRLLIGPLAIHRFSTARLRPRF